MPVRSVTVFGGTGFLGRRVVAALAQDGAEIRVASRHPDGPPSNGQSTGRPIPVQADIRDGGSIERALEGADAVVNCVSLYRQTRTARFDDVHVAGAATLAEAAAARGLRLLHVSGLGADPGSPSPYVRARGLGEERVRATCPEATILRPSVMFGPDDAFLRTLDRIAALTPVIPLFGTGDTRLQPVHVGDVAAAAARAVRSSDSAGRIYELGGPEVLTYRRVLARVLGWRGRRRLLVPLPFAVWDGLAAIGEWLPGVPITEGQVALMKRDNVVSGNAAGLDALGLTPQPLDAVASAFLR